MESFPEISELSLTALQTGEFRTVTIVAALAAGVLYCFLGYRVLKFLIALTGFLAAGAVAAALAGLVTSANTVAVLIGGAIGGLAGAFALLFLYKLGVFFIGTIGAALVAQAVLGGRPEAWAPLAVFGVSVAGGFVALVIERPVMILATSAIGAWILVCVIALFVVGPAFLEDTAGALQIEGAWPSDAESGSATALKVALASWVGLLILGAWVQFASYRKPASEPPQAK